MNGKKILIALGSPRKNGNTATLAKWVAAGAGAAGAEVELVELAKLENAVGGCASCYGCQKKADFKCVLHDATAALINRLPEFDVVVFATPIYFFNFSGLTKQFMDRFMALCNAKGSALKKIQFAVVATSEGDASDSGLEVLRLNMKYLTEFTQMPEVKFFHHGCCGEGIVATDAVLQSQAEYFGRELAR